MKCPTCDEPLDVVDSRATGRYVRRNRRCRGCRVKMTTFELPVERGDVLLLDRSSGGRMKVREMKYVSGPIQLQPVGRQWE